MMVRRGVLLAVVAGLVWAAPAGAQTPAASGASNIGARVFGHFERQSMTAKDTFEAVTDTSALSGLGGGVEVQQLWRRLFVRAAVSRLSETGQRVFVFDGQVFPLGIPLELSLTPIELAAGWRFKPFGSRGIVPYVGGGALFLKFKESSPGDSSSEGVDETYNGVLLFGGLEIPVWKRVSAGAEVGWRKATVADPGGALAALDEKDLGGVTMRLMVSIRR